MISQNKFDTKLTTLLPRNGCFTFKVIPSITKVDTPSPQVLWYYLWMFPKHYDKWENATFLIRLTIQPSPKPHFGLSFIWQMLKASLLKSSDLHFSVIKWHCQTYDDNIGPKFKKPRFAILGCIICSTISLTSIGPRFVQKYCKSRAFSNIFSNILTALCRVYFGGPRNVGPRI